MTNLHRTVDPADSSLVAFFIATIILVLAVAALGPGCALLAFSRPLFDSCSADYRDERYEQSRYVDWPFRQESVTREGVVVDGTRDPMVLARIDGLIEATGGLQTSPVYAIGPQSSAG